MSQSSSIAKVAVFDYTRREHPDTMLYGRTGMIPETLEIASVAWSKIPFSKYPSVCHVINRSMGTEHLVDTGLADVHQIPDYCSDAVSDYVIQRVRADDPLLVVGIGRIGDKVLDKHTNSIAAHHDTSKEALKEYIRHAVAVTVHTPLTKDTKKFWDAELFDVFDDTVFINTSRAGVVDEKALLAALDSGRVAYAYLDVASSRELQRHPNVSYTNHSAWYTPESVERRKDLYLSIVRSLI